MKEYLKKSKYLKKGKFGIYPYQHFFSLKKIKVYKDKTCNMRYVFYNDEKLYFMKYVDVEQIKGSCIASMMEQSQGSPHRYESAEFYVEEGDIVADIGASMGDFALSVIDRVKKIYLFEADKKWIEALEKTFAPWKEKVEIINKYVSNIDNDQCITLDTFFKNRSVNFIKADIEGAERSLLEGAGRLLALQNHMKIVLCTYHYQKDAEVLNQKLIEKDFQTHFSDGYVLLALDKLAPPYLRKALVRGVKK
jgi:precorrin-6B methylase 2